MDLLTYSSKLFSIIFWGSREIFNGFSVVFQASTGKKLWKKLMKKITGPRNLMLNILTCTIQIISNKTAGMIVIVKRSMKPLKYYRIDQVSIQRCCNPILCCCHHFLSEKKIRIIARLICTLRID